MKTLVLLLAYFSIATAKAAEICPGAGTIKGAQASDVVAQVILTKKHGTSGLTGYTKYDAEAQLFYRPENKESFNSAISIPKRCKVTIGVRYIVGCNRGNICDYVVPFTLTPRRKPRAKNTKASSSSD